MKYLYFFLTCLSFGIVSGWITYKFKLHWFFNFIIAFVLSHAIIYENILNLNFIEAIK